MERLIIKNFLGIKELEIELKKINILIGKQASGKSICAKLLFYFKEFFQTIIEIAAAEKNKRDFDKLLHYKFNNCFSSSSWKNDNFLIRYELNDNFVEISQSIKNSNKIILNYSESYHKELNSLKKILRTKQKNIEKKEYIIENFNLEIRKEMIHHTQKKFGNESTFSQIFIPAGRSFFSNLQNNIFSFLSNQNSLDPFLEQFGSIYENIKTIRSRIYKSFKGKYKNEIEEIMEQILCGKYIYEKGQDFLEILDGRKINIANASSGQQETLPLAIMLSTLSFLEPLSGGQTVYIEEPEAHLFPTSQKKIIELIATVFNSNHNQFQFFITTHSPYILTATNNLLQAGLIYQNSSQNILQKLNKVIPQFKALNNKDIAVYSLLDGKSKSIISEETYLIDTNIIDQVSDELAIEFDSLLELELI